jgi:hypothetical protein
MNLTVMTLESIGGRSCRLDSRAAGSLVRLGVWNLCLLAKPSSTHHGVNELAILQVVVDRTIYAAITMISVLIICDVWQHLSLVDVVGVVVGPDVTVFLAPIFLGVRRSPWSPRAVLSGF